MLGPVVIDGSESNGALRLQQQRVLAALALDQGRVVTEDRLIEVLWTDGEEAPANPRGALQTYVSRLRAMLGFEAIVTSPPGYFLEVAVEVDLAVAESLIGRAAGAREHDDLDDAAQLLTEALGLWRGEALGELADEDWARPAARRLDELHLSTREDLGEVLVDVGRYEDAIADLEALVEAHPLRERAWELLMRALHGASRQAEALRAFARYRDVLAEETGLEPSPELVELDRQIVERDPRLEIAARPRRLAGYELRELIGEGAFGTIYLAIQPSVGREVAIKVVKAELANDPAFVRRFEVEAQTVARLEHPHIVPLHDFWRDPSGAYLVMRLLKGGTAETRLTRDGPWHLEAVTRLVEEIGAALAVAHESGVVHRDVKPGNVLFDEAGNSYLTDFGIASAVRGSEAADLRSAGSPLYVSPEQIRDGEASPLSDMYALGVMVYELLAGSVPFGDSQSMEELFGRKLREPVPSLLQRRPELPEGVDAVIQTATATIPDRRFESMGEFVLAFRAAAATLPGSSTTGSADGVEGDRPRRLASQTLVAAQLEATNPYKGLAAFDEADTDDFFGRQDLTAELVAHLQGSRFLVVTGPSGSGKSSVVRAGVLPEMRRKEAFVASMIPGIHPMDELETALLRLAVRPVGSILEQLTEDENGIDRVLRRVLPDDGTELVLVLDQFEELFTLTPEGRRDAFLAALLAAITNERSRLRVVATLRADFYDRPLQHPTISDLVRTNTVAVSTLSVEELNAAIVGPAERVGVTVEPALAVELIAEARSEAAILPLLQYALTEVYEQRERGSMTLSSYRAIGGISGALAKRANELHDSLDLAERTAVRRLFTRLITPGEGTEDTRRRVRRSELAAIDGHIIDSYGRARLLTFDHDPATREPTVEVAHEAIIREWPILRQWLDDDREGLRILRHLNEAAAEWETSGKPASELYRGGRLESAEEWATPRFADLTGIEREYLTASVDQRTDEREAERRRLRRLRTLLVGTAVVALIALAAGAIALQQQRRADTTAREAQIAQVAAEDNADLATQRQTDAETRRLASEAGFRVQADRQVGLLLAAEAYRRDPGPVSIGALQRALTGIGTYAGTLESGSPYSTVRWLDDARIVATGSEGVAVVDTSSAQRLEWHATPTRTDRFDTGDAAFLTWGFASASADTVALVPSDEPTVVRVIGMGARAFDLEIAHAGEVDGVELAPDASTIATIDQDDVIRLFDLPSASLRWQTQAHPETVFDDLGVDPGVEYVAQFLLPENERGRSTTEKIRHRLRFTPDGTEIVTQESILRRWDTRTGKQIGQDVLVWRTRPERPGAQVVSHPQVTFMTDRHGDRMMVHDHGGITVVNVVTGEVSSSAEVADAGDLYGLAKVSTVRWDGGNTAWVLLNDSRLLHVSLKDGTAVEPAINTQVLGAADLAISPNGRMAAIAGDSGIALFALDGSQAIARAFPRNGTHTGSVSPDGTLLTQDYGENIHFFEPGFVYDISGPEPVAVDRPDDVLVTHAAGFGNMFIAATRSYQLQPRNLATLEPLGPPLEVRGGWNGQTATYDNRLLAAGTALDGVRIFDVRTGEVVSERRELGNLTPSLSFNADGTRLAGTSVDGRLIVWDTATWEIVWSEAGVISVRYSPSGALMVTMDPDGNMAIRSPETNEVTKDLVGSGNVDVADAPFYFSDSDKYLVVSGDRAARLWDLEVGEQIGDLFPNDPDNVILGADGAPTFVTAVGDHRLVWELDVDSWPAIACRLAGRNLTLAEWDQFGPEDSEYQTTCPQWASGKSATPDTASDIDSSSAGLDPEVLGDQAALEILNALRGDDLAATELLCESWEQRLLDAADTAAEIDASPIGSDPTHRFWVIDAAAGLCGARSFDEALDYLEIIEADPHGSCIGYPSPCVNPRQ